MVLKHIMPLSAAILLLLGVAIVPALALLPNDQQAPDFQLSDLSNNAYKLSNYRGKVVVIDFFGAHCPQCKEDATTNLIPFYIKNYESDTKVQFLSVETNGADAATIKGSYLQGISVPWPVLTGGNRLVKSYDFSTVPTLYVIDSAGKVALTMQYPTNTQTLKATIDKLEAGTSTPTPSPTARSSTQPPAKPSESPKSPTTSVPKTSPTPSPKPSPTSGSEKSKSTQPAVSTGAISKPVPVSARTSEQQSNTSQSRSDSSSSGAAFTIQPTKPSTQTSEAVRQQDKTPDLDPIRPSTQPSVNNASDTRTDDAIVVTTMVITAAPLDSSSSNKSEGQSASPDSKSTSDSSQGTSLSTASLATVTTETTNATVQYIAALTGQTSSGASLPPQPALEFSLLGLWLPAIVVGVICLMMRRF